MMTKSERWAAIPRFEGRYEASSLGRIRSVDWIDGNNHSRKGKLLKQYPATNGYPCVDLRLNGKTLKERVHILVLETFTGPRPTGQVALHVDDARMNNRLSNLSWGTHRKNCATRKWARGKLSRSQVIIIKAHLHAGTATLTELATRFKVDRRAIGHIRSGRNYADI